jgi:hypothetical protein
MTETSTEPMETTMTMTKRNCANSIVGNSGGTPNPKDKKAPRSILKGKIPKENEEETKKTKKEENEIANPSIPTRDKGWENHDTASNLGNKFEAAIYNEESTARNNKNMSSNEEVEEINDNEELKHEGTENEKELDNDNGKEEKTGEEKEKQQEEMDKMEKDKYCLDLHGGEYKKHTREWRSISEGVMNASTTLTQADEGYMHDLIENMAKEMDTNLDKMDNDSWIKIFIKTKDISAARNKRRFIRIFEVSLAKSDPKELFNQAIFDRTSEDMPGTLSILDTTGTRVTLARHEPQIATETLGVWQAMDGNNKEQIAQLHKKMSEFAECIRTGFLSKNDAWHSIQTTIMKTLEYSMIATTIQEKEWEYIMAPMLKVGLPRAGFARTFPRAVLYGPSLVQGLEVFHPWYHQEILHLLTILNHTEQKTITGQLLTTSFEQLRLELGTSGYLTDTSYKTVQKMVTKT